MGRKTHHISFISAFLAILSLPWLVEVIGSTNEASLDNRELAPKPEWGSPNYTSAWESYYSDHYGLRNQLISWGGYIKSQIFKSSPKPDIVVFGRHNWLFYNSKDDQIFNSYSNSNTLNPEESELFYQDFYRKRKFCEAQDVKFYKITWPNKHTIYKAAWSWKMKRQPVVGHSKRQQIQLLFQQKGDPYYLDLTEHLWKHRTEAQIYRKYDTHWNQLGAFFAYQRVIQFIFAKEEAFEIEDFDIEYKEQFSGDLVKLMGIKQMSKPEMEPFLRFKGELDTVIQQYDLNGVGVNDFRNRKVKEDKVLLIFGDSYTDRIQWLFLLHFSRVIYVKTGFNEDLIRKFQPDFVFEAQVERYL